MPKQQLRTDLLEEIPSSAVSEMVSLRERIIILLEEMVDFTTIVMSAELVNDKIIDYIDAWNFFPRQFKEHNDWQIANHLFCNKVADLLRNLIIEVSCVITSDERYYDAYKSAFASIVYSFELIQERDTHVSRVTLDRAMVNHSSICIPDRNSLLKESPFGRRGNLF